MDFGQVGCLAQGQTTWPKSPLPSGSRRSRACWGTLAKLDGGPKARRPGQSPPCISSAMPLLGGLWPGGVPCPRANDLAKVPPFLTGGLGSGDIGFLANFGGGGWGPRAKGHTPSRALGKAQRLSAIVCRLREEGQGPAGEKKLKYSISMV